MKIALKPLTLWFTGLSGAGKSTIAEALRLVLLKQNSAVALLDGDAVRKGVSNDLGFDAASRTENLRRIAHMAALLNQQEVFVIVATISPFQKDREMVKSIIGTECYREIYVSTALTVCELRDPKGLYQLAHSDKIKNFTGITAPYEIPRNSHLNIDTAHRTLDQSVQEIILAFSLA